MPVLREEAVAGVHDAGGRPLLDRFEGGEVRLRAPFDQLHGLDLGESDGEG